MANDSCSHYEELPSDERSWHIYIIVSCIIYFTGLICILIGQNVWKVVRQWSIRNEKEADVLKPMNEYKGWYLQIKEFAVNLDTGKSMLGKILVRFLFLYIK